MMFYVLFNAFLVFSELFEEILWRCVKHCGQNMRASTKGMNSSANIPLRWKFWLFHCISEQFDWPIFVTGIISGALLSEFPRSSLRLQYCILLHSITGDFPLGRVYFLLPLIIEYNHHFVAAGLPSTYPLERAQHVFLKFLRTRWKMAQKPNRAKNLHIGESQRVQNQSTHKFCF